MKNPIPAIPWQVQAIGLGIGALVVVGYFVTKKLGSAGAAVVERVSDAAEGALSTVTTPFGVSVAKYAYNPEYTYSGLLAGGLIDGDKLNAAGLRSYLKFQGVLNLDGTIPSPQGDITLIFNAAGGVIGQTIKQSGASGSW